MLVAPVSGLATEATVCAIAELRLPYDSDV